MNRCPSSFPFLPPLPHFQTSEGRIKAGFLFPPLSTSENHSPFPLLPFPYFPLPTNRNQVRQPPFFSLLAHDGLFFLPFFKGRHICPADPYFSFSVLYLAGLIDGEFDDTFPLLFVVCGSEVNGSPSPIPFSALSHGIHCVFLPTMVVCRCPAFVVVGFMRSSPSSPPLFFFFPLFPRSFWAYGALSKAGLPLLSLVEVDRLFFFPPSFFSVAANRRLRGKHIPSLFLFPLLRIGKSPFLCPSTFLIFPLFSFCF